MNTPVDVTIYFNFRSPYCYLASKKLWPIFDDYNTNLIWRPVGGWDLRSSPDRAKSKMPLARQDMARFARRMGIPVSPPPTTHHHRPDRSGGRISAGGAKGAFAPLYHRGDAS